MNDNFRHQSPLFLRFLKFISDKSLSDTSSWLKIEFKIKDIVLPRERVRKRYTEFSLIPMNFIWGILQNVSISSEKVWNNFIVNCSVLQFRCLNKLGISKEVFRFCKMFSNSFFVYLKIYMYNRYYFTLVRQEYIILYLLIATIGTIPYFLYLSTNQILLLVYIYYTYVYFNRIENDMYSFIVELFVKASNRELVVRVGHYLSITI